jgi:4-amino-4-deoxy-L-arabinose transferase-like glycosyltransferase
MPARRRPRWRERALGDPLLWSLIVGGTVIRGVVTAATHGLPYDVHSWQLVRSAFAANPLHVYSAINAGGNFHWPYPPGFFPLMLVASGAADLVGGAFTYLVRIPSILADGALAWLVWIGLRDTTRGMRLAAVALIAVSPVFVTISAYSAQIDAVAILPAVGALLVWERAASERRAWMAGLLIGLAAAVKTVPLVMVLALLPTVRSRREAAILVGCALAVPLVTALPFLIADPSGVAGLRRYAGSPGLGGLSLVLQPDLAQRWLTQWVNPTALTRWLFIDHAGPYNALTMAAFGAWALRFRPSARAAAAILWLVVLACGSGFFFQYLVWGIPFFLLAGFVRATAVLQAAVTAPMILYYLGPWRPGDSAVVYVYVPLMLLVWGMWSVAALLLGRRAALAGTT